LQSLHVNFKVELVNDDGYLIKEFGGEWCGPLTPPE